MGDRGGGSWPFRGLFVSSGVGPACAGGSGRAGLWEKSCWRLTLSTTMPAGARRAAPVEICPINGCFSWENVAIAGSFKHHCHSYCFPEEPDKGREGCVDGAHRMICGVGKVTSACHTSAQTPRCPLTHVGHFPWPDLVYSCVCVSYMVYI